MALTKSELIERIADRQNQLSPKDVELAVKTLIEQMADSLAGGGRIEIRGFGSFPSIFVRPVWDATPRPVPASSCTANMFPTSNPVKSCASALTIHCMKKVVKVLIMAQAAIRLPLTKPRLLLPPGTDLASKEGTLRCETCTGFW